MTEIIVSVDSVELSMSQSQTSPASPVSGERTFRAEDELDAAGVATGPASSDVDDNAGTIISSTSSKEKQLEEPLCPDNKTGYGAIHTSAPRMYDPDATLSISKDVASGYLVLLSGGGCHRLIHIGAHAHAEQQRRGIHPQ